MKNNDQSPVPVATPVAETGVVKASPKVFKLSEFLEGDNAYSPAQIELIKNTVAKNTTDLELAYFLSICKGVRLNPLIKEIWCYKDKKNKLLIFGSKDGFRRKAHESKDVISINSIEVREGDDFAMGVQDGEICVKRHEFIPSQKRFKKGILGAYAIIKVKRSGEIGYITEWAEFSRYNKGWDTWGTHPEEMIKKVAEVHAIKKVVNLSGIYAEEEMNGTVNSEGYIEQPSQTDLNNDTAQELFEKIKHCKTEEELDSLRGDIQKLPNKYRKELGEKYVKKLTEIRQSQKPETIDVPAEPEAQAPEKTAEELKDMKEDVEAADKATGKDSKELKKKIDTAIETAEAKESNQPTNEQK